MIAKEHYSLNANPSGYNKAAKIITDYIDSNI